MSHNQFGFVFAPAASVLIDRSVLPSHDLAVAIAVHWLSSREKRELTIDNSKQIKSDVDGVAQYIGSTGGFYSPRQRHSLDFMGQDDWLISFFSKSRQLDTSPPHGLSSEAGVQTHSSAVARFLEIWQSGACDSAARKEVEALLSSTPLGGRVLHGCVQTSRKSALFSSATALEAFLKNPSLVLLFLHWSRIVFH